ncbi:MAG TPA: FkbM family methyltransferase [Smithella sp.]|nr:FkbM family methyltransferase [Smithella sp.]
MSEISKSYLKQLINNPKPFILDVGTYDGKDAYELSKEWDHNCTVHCFEPDNRSRAIFISKYTGIKSMTLHPFALTDVDGEVDFYKSDSETRRHENGANFWAASSSCMKPTGHLKAFPDVSFYSPEKVQSKRLDSWYTPGMPIIDLAWVDVNGAEERFLRGSRKSLLFTRFVFMEISHGLYKDSGLSLMPDFDLIDVYDRHDQYENILFKNKFL